MYPIRGVELGFFVMSQIGSSLRRNGTTFADGATQTQTFTLIPDDGGGGSSKSTQNTRTVQAACIDELNRVP